MNRILAALLLAFSLPALAALEAGGVKFEERTKIGAADAAINGAGVRGVLFIKGYAIALYLPRKTPSAAEALAMPGAKRVRLVLLREATGETFAEALANGIRKNHSEAEVAALNARIDALKATLLAIAKVEKGAVVELDWLPASGAGAMRLTINGERRGEDIAGEDFYRALLRIWIGERPIQQDLKDHLLGKQPD